MYKLVVFLCLSSVAFAQINLQGKCELKSTQPLDINGLVGEWHQLKRINEVGSVDGNCLSLKFSYNETTKAAGITSTSVTNRTRVSRNATITLKDTSGVLHINYTDGIQYDMVVEKTDLTNYLIIHGCSESGSTKSVYGQVYTRVTNVSEAITTTINGALQAIPDFTTATWNVGSHAKEACDTDSGVNLQVTSFLFLIVGLVLAKDM